MISDRFVSAEVPFVVVGNCQALTDEQLLDNPGLAAFARRFAYCFRRDEAMCCYFFYPDDAPSN